MAEAMGIARDWAVILLALESLILSLVPLFIYWKAAQGLGKLLPRVRPFLRRVRSVADQGTTAFARRPGPSSGPLSPATRRWRRCVLLGRRLLRRSG